MSSPRILYVSPWTSKAQSASELRTQRIVSALQQMGTVEVIAVGEERQITCCATEDDGVRVAGLIGMESRPNRGWPSKAKWLLNPRLPFPHGVAAEDRGMKLLRTAAREFDLIWFFKLRTANLFPEWAWPNSVVDVDDVPSQFERSVMSTGLSAPARVAMRLRISSWQRRERLLGERFSVLTVCSEADRRYLMQLGVSAPMYVVANGFEPPNTTPVRQLATPPRLGFIGVFDHAPNATGVQWFVRHCWPRIKREIADVRLRLVGRFTDGPLAPVGPDIDALGYLPDTDSEMATWSGMVVPVHTGAGTRGKIAHAFSRKCPVISTSLGAYGYEPTHGHDMLVGDSAEQFAAACIRVIQHPQEAAQISERAWERFLGQWTWEAIRPQVWAAADGARRRANS